MKKIVSVLLVFAMVISLFACGSSSGGSASIGSSNTKQVKSSFKGDFVFYKKADGSYFTDNNDIPETLLTKNDLSDIYIDEKRKNIVFTVGYGYSSLYIKSLKNLDEEAIEIGNVIDGGINIWKNQKIIWKDDKSIFIYDLDSKKKDRIAEGVERYYDVQGDTMTYFEASNSHISKMVIYNIKNNNKKERDISSFRFDGFGLVFAGNIAYVRDANHIVQGKEQLYKLTIDNDPVLITEADANNDRRVVLDMVDAFKNGELYYRTINCSDENCYYYDGNSNNNIKLDCENLRSIKKDIKGLEKLKPETPIIITHNGGNLGFIADNKTYERKGLQFVSSDGNKILFKDFIDNQKSKILNIKSGEIDELKEAVKDITAFDSNNLLYRTTNDDLILNNEIIDYKVENSAKDRTKNSAKYSDDFSTIIYTTGDRTLTVWKNGNINVITSKPYDYQITNNNNVYYTKDNQLYLFKDNESNLTTDNVSSIYDYNIIR